jgi:hypothetical protein
MFRTSEQWLLYTITLTFFPCWFWNNVTKFLLLLLTHIFFLKNLSSDCTLFDFFHILFSNLNNMKWNNMLFSHWIMLTLHFINFFCTLTLYRSHFHHYFFLYILTLIFHTVKTKAKSCKYEIANKFQYQY